MRKAVGTDRRSCGKIGQARRMGQEATGKGLREVGSLEGKGLKCPNSEPLLPDGLPNPQPLPRPGHLLLGSLEPWF